MGSAMDKMGGKAKQAVGKTINNKEMQAKGKMQELKGEAEEKIDHLKDKITRGM